MEAMLNRIGVRQFTLAGELEPGFPLGIATLSDGRKSTLGMKAGGFGDDDTLLRAADLLCSRSERAI